MSPYEAITHTTSIQALLHFARGVAEAKCILVTAVCASVCVCLSLATFPHYCVDPDVTRGNGRGCPVVVHYKADLQSVHGFRCYDNTALNATCQRVLVLALRLVVLSDSVRDRPMSSLAQTMSRRAMKSASSPPSIIRTNQYIAALSSEPRIDLCKAEIQL